MKNIILAALIGISAFSTLSLTSAFADSASTLGNFHIACTVGTFESVRHPGKKVKLVEYFYGDAQNNLMHRSSVHEEWRDVSHLYTFDSVAAGELKSTELVHSASRRTLFNKRGILLPTQQLRNRVARISFAVAQNGYSVISKFINEHGTTMGYQFDWGGDGALCNRLPLGDRAVSQK